MTKEMLNFNQIDQEILVYKNPFTNLDALVSSLETKDWGPWYTFGDIYKVLKNNSYRSETFPSDSEWKEYTESCNLSNEESDIFNVFYSVTKHYTEFLDLSFDNWLCSNIDICKYYDANKTSELEKHSSFTSNESTYTMSFHTDYPQESMGCPGEKQMMTCNMYLNDNYSGGEIEFKIFSEDGDFKRITYKPEAGDVVIFPSKPPYWHGVRETTDGEKYFVRSFWYTVDKPSAEWLENEKKYGSDIWKEMEEDRKNKERKSGVHIRND